MKKFLFCCLFLMSACTNLTASEQRTLRELKNRGIDIDHPQSSWEKPANPAAAGALNILPGFGNFYLASGNAGQSEHYLYGALNLLTWPISILWGIPEAAIDAGNINKRELIYYYTYDRPQTTSLQSRRNVRQYQPSYRSEYYY